jgi:hypothetical protein
MRRKPRLSGWESLSGFLSLVPPRKLARTSQRLCYLEHPFAIGLHPLSSEPKVGWQQCPF